MDFYNIFFSVGVSVGLFFAFYKPAALIGRILLIATFAISAFYGFLNPTDVFKIGIDLLVVAFITQELLSKRYRNISAKQNSIGALIGGLCAIVLGAASPVFASTCTYLAAGIILLAQSGLTWRHAAKVA